jgi:hypothetical protein
MITFEAVDAGYGDCILVRYHSKARGFERILLVDGGPSKAAPKGQSDYSPYADRLIPRLMQIKTERNARGQAKDGRANEPKAILDLVVCTHIDADHIDGIKQFYQCLSDNGGCAPDGKAVEAPLLWFNSFSKLMEGAPDIDQATKDAHMASVGDGDHLTDFANNAGAMINHGRPGELTAAGQIVVNQFEPLKVTITNPGAKQLKKLQKLWSDTSKVTAEMALAGAGGKTPGDTSTANLSSIVMLLEGFGRSILLTGDQRGDHILASLKAMKLLRPDGKLHLDIMKVPHHGAVANNQQSFHDAVTADTYVFCANGKNSNPDGPVLEIIARQAKDRAFTMAFTQADFIYDKPTKVNGKKVKTLQESIRELKKLPGVSGKIEFVHRESTAHSWIKELQPR